MSILLVAQNRDMIPYRNALLQQDPNLEVEIWPHVSDRNRVNFAVAWNHPQNVFLSYPNLHVISSLGAGVDHLLSDPSLPEHVTLTRVLVPTLGFQMSEYVMTAVLNLIRNTYGYYKQQLSGKWQRLPSASKNDFTVGVMGLGEIGKRVAEDLEKAGFKVTGWSRTPKDLKGIQTFSETELPDFLKATQIAVCLLPLTDQTIDILDLDLFKQLKKPAYIINAGRGEHLVDEDLIYALDAGLIEHAVLDVFRTEPLPDSHPFRGRENIIITPHIASETDPGEVAELLVENYKRMLSGMELLHRVDTQRGY